MTTANKLAKQIIVTVEQAEICCDLMRHKLTLLLQTQPLFNLFDFEEKSKHPYYKLIQNADQARDSLKKLVKGVGKWSVGNSNVQWEVDVKHANYITGVRGADAATVALVQAWSKRAVKASVASDLMIDAFKAATYCWSKSSKQMIQIEILRNMKGHRTSACIEKGAIDINADFKKLLTELKKLNKELRSVKRGKQTMMSCYKDLQLIHLMKHSQEDKILTILMK